METTDIKKKIAKDYKEIKGWGIDADPDNNPTYPMKRYTGADHQRLNYTRPQQQPVTTEILHSIERPGVSSVFGATLPPRGLSGVLRRYAFKFSEGSSGHWLTLLLADRVDVVEGILDDLKQGYIPNFLKERGWAAEWKYNRKGAIKNIAVGVGIASAIIGYAIYCNRNKRIEEA